MTTNDIDKIIHDFIISQNAYPTAIGFLGFPKSVCTSVNEGFSIFFTIVNIPKKLFAMEFRMKDLWKMGII